MASTTPKSLADGQLTGTSWGTVWTVPATHSAVGLKLSGKNVHATQDTTLKLRITRSGGTAREQVQGWMQRAGGFCRILIGDLSAGDLIEISQTLNATIDWILTGGDFA